MVLQVLNNSENESSTPFILQKDLEVSMQIRGLLCQTLDMHVARDDPCFKTLTAKLENPGTQD